MRSDLQVTLGHLFPASRTGKKAGAYTLRPLLFLSSLIFAISFTSTSSATVMCADVFSLPPPVGTNHAITGNKTIREFANNPIFSAVRDRPQARQFYETLARLVHGRERGPIIIESGLSVIGQFRQKDNEIRFEISIVQDVVDSYELSIGQRPGGLNMKFIEFLAALSAVAESESAQRPEVQKVLLIAGEIENPVIFQIGKKLGGHVDPKDPTRFVVPLDVTDRRSR